MNLRMYRPSRSLWFAQVFEDEGGLAGGEVMLVRIV